jgi:hypothetical protein
MDYDPDPNIEAAKAVSGFAAESHANEVQPCRITIPPTEEKRYKAPGPYIETANAKGDQVIFTEKTPVIITKRVPIIENESKQTLTDTLKERGKRYGKFTGHASITQMLKDVMRNTSNWDDLLTHDQCEALEMIAHKIGRILNGDPDYGDSWIDIAGYAQLVADRLEGVER